MLLYIGILLLALLRIDKKSMAENTAEKPKIDLEKGNSIFIYCKTHQIKDNIYTYYKNEGQSVCIDNFAIDRADDSVKAPDFFKYLCRLSGADEQKAKVYLSLIKGDLNGELNPELVQKIYFCVKCSKDSPLYVINDFFKNHSLQFEKDFSPLLNQLSENAKILYLGTVHYIAVNGFNGYYAEQEQEFNSYEAIPIRGWERIYFPK